MSSVIPTTLYTVTMPFTDEQIDATIASLEAILATLRTARGDAPAAPVKKSRAKQASPPSEEPKPAVAPSEKRIARVTPKIKQAVQQALQTSYDEKKHPKQYVDFVNKIPDASYTKGPLEYMQEFLQSIGHAVETEITIETYSELSADVKASIVDEPSPDVFRGADGRTYTIRAGLPDEDFEPRTINGTNYMVGPDSGRVYETRTDEHGFEKDIWVGFLGVGAFA